ncbi:hypothetical protein H4582DRAFT_1907433 [Lactarius indigo]|nr:hypothetical protein H4582DRAFT_1907433 [Lactarius indigo]
MDDDAAINIVEKYEGLVAFGRYFISNEGHTPTRYNCDTFYTTESAARYIGYPFANDVVALHA